MVQVVTLNLPEEVAACSSQIALETHRRLEDVLVEWLDRATIEPPIETLSDAEVIALCDLQLSETHQSELDDLLYDQREGQLAEKTRK